MWNLDKGVGFIGTRITGGCELTDVGSGNQSQVLSHLLNPCQQHLKDSLLGGGYMCERL